MDHGYLPPDEDRNFRDLLQRVQEGSEAAAWELVEQYGEAIRRAVRRTLNRRLRPKFDSLDFVQVVWSSFFRVRGRLDQFNRPEELAAFLTTVARNKVAMEVRRRMLTEKYNVNREHTLHEPEAESPTHLPDREPAPVDVAIARERWDRLLQGQSEHYRQIIELRLQGRTNQEIADTLGIAESTVRRFLKRLLQATSR